jgi:hypothetical protein
VDQLPTADGPYVLIKHQHLSQWIEALRAKEFEQVYAVMVIREPIATCRSMVKAGHWPDFSHAYRHRTELIATNCADAIACGARLEIVTYEGLCPGFLRDWLPRIGLPFVAGPLKLPGQRAPTAIVNQNAKHYG